MLLQRSGEAQLYSNHANAETLSIGKLTDIGICAPEDVSCSNSIVFDNQQTT